MLLQGTEPIVRLASEKPLAYRARSKSPLALKVSDLAATTGEQLTAIARGRAYFDYEPDNE